METIKFKSSVNWDLFKNMEKKYILTEKTKEFKGHTLYRIQAVKDFGEVKKGDLGGWIESEKNLSQDDDSWVGGEAIVFGNGLVSGNAWVFDDARVYGNAWVTGDAKVFNNARIYGEARVFGYALVSGDSKVFDSAQVFDNATVTDFGFVNGCAEISGDAIVTFYSEFMVFRSNWDGRYFTWTKSNNKWKVGSFYGTDEELLEEFYKESKDKGYYYEQFVNFKKQLANLKKP